MIFIAKAIKIKKLRKEEKMKKKKLLYSEAELEIILLSSGDIICTSSDVEEDPDDPTNIPGYGGNDWNGWN